MADILLGNVKGPQGNTGATGSQGPQGDAATITVGTVSTTAYGNTASVTNSGTEQDAVLDFVIPQGKPGEQTTRMGALTLDTITAQSADFPIPAVGETGSTVFGKIIKFFNSTISALNSKLNISDVVNNLTSTSTTQPLSAAQGKALNDAKVNLSDLRKITYIASKDLGWDTGRGTAAFNNNGSLSLPSAGIYLFVTETWTKSDFNTRTWAAMDNTVANIGMTTKSPPKIVGEGYLQIIQLCVASSAMTVNCQYWDGAGTGTAHRWTAYKLFA